MRKSARIIAAEQAAAAAVDLDPQAAPSATTIHNTRSKSFVKRRASRHKDDEEDLDLDAETAPRRVATSRNNKKRVDKSWVDDDDDPDDPDDAHEPHRAAPTAATKKARSKAKRRTSKDDDDDDDYDVEQQQHKQQQEEEEEDDDDEVELEEDAGEQLFGDEMGEDDEDAPVEELRLFAHQREGIERIMRGLLRDKYVAKEVRVDLMGYHEDADFRLLPTRCFLLYDEMGLGKTIQALESLHRLKVGGHLRGPSLVVAPPSCVHVWAREIERFFGAHFTVAKFMDAGIKASTLEDLTNAHVVVTTYPVLTNCFITYVKDELDNMSLAQLTRFCMVMQHSTAEARNLPDAQARKMLLELARPDAEKGKGGRVKDEQRRATYKTLMQTEWACAIFDEVQKVKTPSSTVTRAVATLQCAYRLGLSGTPIMNSGKEMISLLKFGLGLLDVDFHTISRDPDGPYTRYLLKTISLGRLKKDLPEVLALLPQRDKAAERVIVEWTEDPHAVKVYRSVRDASLAALSQAEAMEPRRPGESASDYNARRLSGQTGFWTTLQRLRLVCLHRDVPQYSLEATFQPAMSWPDWNTVSHSSFPVWFQHKVMTLHLCLRRVYSSAVNKDVRRLICQYFSRAEQYVIQPSPKMLKFLDLYRDMERTHPTNRKMVVVSSSRVFQERIFGPWLSQIGIKWSLFAGNGKKKQQLALERFRDDPDCTVLVLVKAAGSLGLNLQFAAHLILMDPHWNNALDEQAAQRVDRIGQKHAVVIRKLYMRSSIDVVMETLQERKAKVTDAWLGRNNKKLNLRDIGLFLREQDQVGEAPKPAQAGAGLAVNSVTESVEVSRVARLDSLINEEHVDEKREVKPVTARSNVLSRDRVAYWLEVVEAPCASVGKKATKRKKTVMLSRSHVVDLMLPLLPTDEPLYDVSYKGRSVPFAVYQVLRDAVAHPEAEPTVPYLSVFPLGQEEFKTRTERVPQGACRSLGMSDFAGFIGVPRKGFSSDYGFVWIDETGHAFFTTACFVKVQRTGPNGDVFSYSPSYGSTFALRDGDKLSVPPAAVLVIRFHGGLRSSGNFEPSKDWLNHSEELRVAAEKRKRDAELRSQAQPRPAALPPSSRPATTAASAPTYQGPVSLIQPHHLVAGVLVVNATTHVVGVLSQTMGNPGLVFVLSNGARVLERVIHLRRIIPYAEGQRVLYTTPTKNVRGTLAKLIDHKFCRVTVDDHTALVVLLSDLLLVDDVKSLSGPKKPLISSLSQPQPSPQAPEDKTELIWRHSSSPAALQSAQSTWQSEFRKAINRCALALHSDPPYSEEDDEEEQAEQAEQQQEEEEEEEHEHEPEVVSPVMMKRTMTMEEDRTAIKKGKADTTAQQAGALDAGWTCPQCTFKNFAIVVECEMCDGPRPASGWREIQLE